MTRTQEAKAQTDRRRLAAIDQLLLAGIKLGPAKKREAIDKVLELVPGWTRGDCWKRIRYLRRNSRLDNSENLLPDGETKSGKRGRVPRSSGAPWTSADDDTLFRLAGYEPVNRIAQRLGRSIRAIRCRLGALGMSGKVTDGWSLRALQKLLRVGPVRLRYFIGAGILRVRDSRVKAGSLVIYCDRNCSSLDEAALQRLKVILITAEDAFSRERTADILGLTLAQVQELISCGQLKLVDWFVTDRSFEEFCKKQGGEISMALIEPATAKWLRNEYGVPDNATNAASVSRAQKHALIIRTCVCGRMIAGNPYFRHIRACRAAGATVPKERSTVLDSSNRILKGAQSKSTNESASLRQSSKSG